MFVLVFVPAVLVMWMSAQLTGAVSRKRTLLRSSGMGGSLKIRVTIPFSGS